MNEGKNKGIKQEEIEQRRMEVEKLHIQGFSLTEISEKLGVDIRTINRDVQENRRERIKMLAENNDARNWLRNELADYISFMEYSKRVFCEQAESFKNESAKTHALWNAVQIANQKVETVKSLIFSLEDLKSGGFRLTKAHEEDEKMF